MIEVIGSFASRGENKVLEMSTYSEETQDRVSIQIGNEDISFFVPKGLPHEVLKTIVLASYKLAMKAS